MFSRMYNFMSRKGPQPIFQCIHNNFGIPLVFRNFECKSCSVLGISKVQTSTEGGEENEALAVVAEATDASEGDKADEWM